MRFLAIVLLAVSTSVTAKSPLQMTSILTCVEESKSSDGLGLGFHEAREFCKNSGVVKMNSIIQCMEEAKSFDGLGLGFLEAREFCKQN